MNTKANLLKTLIREEVRKQLRRQLNEAAPVYKKGERGYNRYDDRIMITHVFPNYAAAVQAYEKDPKLADKLLDGPGYGWEEDFEGIDKNKPVYFVKGPGGGLMISPEEWISVD